MAYSPVQQFYYFIHLLGWKDKVLELLAAYGQTSIKALSADQQIELCEKVRTEWNQRCKRPRGAVIYYLCMMPGYSYKIGDQPNYEAINAWVSTKFDGKQLNQLSLSQLNVAVSAVKRWYDKELKKRQKQ